MRPGQGCLPLAENSWIALLAWFPAHVRLWDELHGCLAPLVGSGRVAGWDPGPFNSLFGVLNHARICTEHPGLVRPPVLLCRQAEPQAVLSVQVLL